MRAAQIVSPRTVKIVDVPEPSLDGAPLITHTLPLDRIQTAYEVFSERKENAIKVVIDYGESASHEKA